MAKAKKKGATQLQPLSIPTSEGEAIVLQLKVDEYLNLLEKDELRLGEIENAIQGHMAELARLGDALRQYAEARRTELRPDERSISLHDCGSLSWFKSKRVVTTRAIKSIIQSLKRRGLRKLIRVTEALNKDAIREHPELIKGTRGIAVESYELFSVKPTGRLSWIEYDPIDGSWSIKRNEKKKASTPLKQAAE